MQKHYSHCSTDSFPPQGLSAALITPMYPQHHPGHRSSQYIKHSSTWECTLIHYMQVKQRFVLCTCMCQTKSRSLLQSGKLNELNLSPFWLENSFVCLHGNLLVGDIVSFRDLKPNGSWMSLLTESKSLVPQHSPSLTVSWYTSTKHAEECKPSRIQKASTVVNLLGF